jgi:hypothetical protein
VRRFSRSSGRLSLWAQRVSTPSTSSFSRHGSFRVLLTTVAVVAFISRSRLASGPPRLSPQPRYCDVLWSARYPCQVSVSDSPPRIDASRCSREFKLPGWPGHLCPGLPFPFIERPVACDSHRPLEGGCSGFVTQPERCDVALVCTLPLSGVGLQQSAGSVASRCADDHARQGGQQ